MSTIVRKLRCGSFIGTEKTDVGFYMLAMGENTDCHNYSHLSVDGYCHETRTVYEFNGFFHGNTCNSNFRATVEQLCCIIGNFEFCAG